jgi:hypothetical protein
MKDETMTFLNKFCIPFAMTISLAYANAEPLGLSGIYRGEAFSLKIQGENCVAISDTGEMLETKCIRKGDLLYIAPILPKRAKMIRNAWPAYSIQDNQLESSHVEDMDSGEIFYKNQKPTIILKKIPK